ncbi:MAG: ATP-binding cassette domain-containing protein [Methanomicrobiales archaeon]|nr:ATP-binding cassette domain-containing protein [Methanomicrobiales archaeon]
MTANSSGRPPFLEFENVSVVKGGRRLLDRISLQIHEGERIAVLGPNGSGKTTLIRTISREYYPAAGDGTIFRVMGSDLWMVADLRRYFGVVSGELQSSFHRGITGREVILSGFFSSADLFHRRITPEMEERAEELIRLLGVCGLADRRMDRLSAGEARRFLIGRALVHCPSFLLLDEPTTGLDLQGIHLFRSTLRRISGSGVGIILATHQLHDIIPEVTRVLLMKGGRFVLDGPKEEVMQDAHISALFGVPVSVKSEEGWYHATSF